MAVDIEDFETPEKTDFRRANGAPMFLNKEGKNVRGSRPSGWGKVLDDENALVNWKLNRAISGVAANQDLQARAIAAKEDDRATWNSLREACIQAGRGNSAADIGTAIHAMSERWEQEPTWDPGPPYRMALEAYTDELTRLGLVSELFEYHVVNTQYNAAGTCDRLYRLTKPLVTPKGEILPVGTLIIGDLKTGASLDFSLPGYTVQMALYARGEMYDVINDTFRPTPDINQDWGLIVHLPANTAECEIVWVDLDVGTYGAFLVKEVRDWRKNWKNGTWAAPRVEDPFMEAEEIAEALDAEIIDEATPEWLEEMSAFIKARMRVIRENPEATQKLATFWPEGAPAPKDISTNDHVTIILTHLDKIEAEFGFTWPENDPRESQPGVRKDDINNKENKK